jgi:hypothetical protein
MNTAEATCPLCQRPSQRHETEDDFRRDVRTYDCERCGRIRVTDEAEREARLLDRARSARVSGLTRERTTRGLPPVLITQTRDAARRSSEPATTLDDILVASALSVQQRLDRTLMNLGTWISLTGDVDPPLAYAEDGAVMQFLMNQLERHGLIRWDGHMQGGHATVQVEGWNRIAELQQGVHTQGSRQGFVAMWFGNPARNPCEVGLVEGIREAGYVPWIAERVEYIDRIDERIISEIRKSTFLVADLSGHRQNVYYEAGFAAGLGIPVVFTCHKDDMGAGHFDTRQYNTIEWSDPEQLATSLQHRITAVIGTP